MSPTKNTVKQATGTQPGPARRVLRSSAKPIPLPPPPPPSASASASSTAQATVQPTTTSKRLPPRRRRAGADPWTVRRKKRPNPNPRPHRPALTHFTCRICADEKPIAEFIEWAPKRSRWRQFPREVPPPCLDHLTRSPHRKTGPDPVCKSCIGRSMSAKMDQNGARTVSSGCLEPGCRSYWDFDFIMKYFPLDSLEKYNEGMFTVWRESIQTFTCLNEECSTVGMLDAAAPGYPQISCSTCNTRMCATCKIPWHTGVTCSEYAARHINEKMTDPEKETLQFMQTKDGKRCPNCFIVIEKDGGCDSMYCQACRTYFNWATAASAVPGAKPVVNVNLWGNVVTPVACELDGILEQEKLVNKVFGVLAKTIRGLF